MEPVVERRREQGRIAARRSRAEERGAPRARGRLRVRHRRGQCSSRRLGRRPRARDDGDRRERERLGDPRDLPVPGEGEAAEERSAEIVGVRFERQAGREQLLRARVRRCRDEPEGDCGRRRSEPALERDRVPEPELLSRRVCEECVRTDGEVVRVARELGRSLSLDDDAGSVRHLELVPEIECDRGRVEACADVRGGCGSADDHARAAAAIASGSASTWASGGA